LNKRFEFAILLCSQIEDDVIELRRMIVKSPEKLNDAVQEQTRKRDELLQSVMDCKSHIEEKKRLTLLLSEERVRQEERSQKIIEIFEIKLSVK